MKCLIIAGLPRGGTSAAAAIAAGLGVPMHLPGDVEFPGLDVRHRYPHGNLEDRSFRELVWSLTGTAAEAASRCAGDECYRHFQRQWRDSLSQGESYELQCWIDKRFDHAQSEGSNVFGVKLPTASSILKPLAHALTRNEIEVVPFFINRSIKDAAESLCAKRGMKVEPSCPMSWALAVQHYNAYHLSKAQSEMARMNIPGYSLTWESVIGDPTHAATSIARRLDLPFRTEAVERVDLSLHSQLVGAV